MTDSLLWYLPFTLQGLAMGLDEAWWHRRRELPLVEGAGHALDTLVFLGCLACPLLLPPSAPHLRLYLALAVGSCLLITKDEWLHQRLCRGGEHWVHAVLFLLHPLVLGATAFLWLSTGGGVLAGIPVPPPGRAKGFLLLQAILVAAFFLIQSLATLVRQARKGAGREIDNALYDALGERWYTATDDPVALLRAEARLRTAWIVEDLRTQFGCRALAVLDVACGAGFLANPLAGAGHRVTGIDLSQESLDVAHRHDPTRSVAYLPMDARALAFPDGQFDVVCMMDFLEHVEDRDQVIGEAARVLKPGGWFLFHTFNRTPLSHLIAIKGVSWFVRNTPGNLHLYRLFLKPAELRALCAGHGLAFEVLRGVRPRVLTWAFLRLILTGRVGDDFQFVFTRSLSIGYCGRARKVAIPLEGLET